MCIRDSSFNDENFILNKKRIEEIAQAAIDLNLNIKMRGGGRVELFLKFDDRYLELFKKAGFYHFALGVESGSNKTLKSITKQITKPIKITNNKNTKKAEDRFAATIKYISSLILNTTQ